jgi:hypothetical protein
VIASKSGQTRHRCPRAGCWIPHLAFVRWIIRLLVWTLSSSASAGHQHFPVRKQCSIVEFTASGHHRGSVLPGRIRTVEIDYLCSCRWIRIATGRVKSAWTPTHEQYLAVIVHHCRSPITSPVVAMPHGTPIASASNAKVPSPLAGPGTEHLSVGRDKHEWIERQRQVRCAQISPGSRCTPPYLRLDIDNPRPDGATDHEHVSVRQRGARRVPSTVVHIRQASPSVVERVIGIGAIQPHPIAYVSTGYEELSIRQKGMA